MLLPDIIKSWFDSFVLNYKEYDLEGSLTIKQNHCYRVCENANKIGKSISLSEQELEAVSIIGLLHDVGRFEQMKQYGTFNDSISIDHGNLSAEIIIQSNLLNNFNLKNEILDAIKFHNKKSLEKLDNSQSMKFLKVVRDADKLDVWNVLTTNLKNKIHNSVLELNLKPEKYFSSNVLDAFLNREIVSYNILETIYDFYLLQLSWIFDFNFEYSYKEIKRNHYLKIYKNLFCDSDEKKKIFNFINNYLKNKFLDGEK